MGLLIKEKLEKAGVSFMALLIAAALSVCIAPAAFADDADLTDGDNTQIEEPQVVTLADEPLAFSEAEGVWKTELTSLSSFEGTLALADSASDFALYDADGTPLSALTPGQEFSLAYTGTEAPGESFTISFVVTLEDGTTQAAVLPCTASAAEEDAGDGEGNTGESGDAGEDAGEGESTGEDAGEGDDSGDGDAGDDSQTTSSTGANSNTSDKPSHSSSSNTSKPGRSHSGGSSGSHSGSGNSKGHSSGSKSKTSGKSSSKSKSSRSGSGSASEQSSSKSGSSGKSKSSESSAATAEGTAGGNQKNKRSGAETPNTDQEAAVEEQAATEEAEATQEEDSSSTGDQAARTAILSTTFAAIGLTGAFASRKLR